MTDTRSDNDDINKSKNDKSDRDNNFRKPSGGDRSFNRPRRDADRPRRSRPEGSSFGDRPRRDGEFKPRGDRSFNRPRPEGSSFGDRPRRDGEFKPRGDRSFNRPRRDADRPRRSRPEGSSFGDRPRRDGGFKPRSFNNSGSSYKDNSEGNDKFKRRSNYSKRDNNKFPSGDIRERLNDDNSELIDIKDKNIDKKSEKYYSLNDTNRLHNKVENTKGRKKSSTTWLNRQANDPHVIQAKEDGYRSRAAYKLLEICDKINILDKERIIDLGSAPGSWSQVIKKHIKNKNSTIVAIDKIEMESIEGVHFIQYDLEKDYEELKNMLPVDNFDVVLSDMGPSSCGNSTVDHIRSIGLCSAALLFASEFLIEGGTLVFKMLQGSMEKEFMSGIKSICENIRYIKPIASRKESSEKYIAVEGFKVEEAKKYVDHLNIQTVDDKNIVTIDNLLQDNIDDQNNFNVDETVEDNKDDTIDNIDDQNNFNVDETVEDNKDDAINSSEDKK